MKKSVTLIKLGGSVITNKEVPMMVREDVLARLVKEIVRAKNESDSQFIIGHGQGSFAHAPALRYKTMDGFIHEESAVGMAITQDSAAQSNRIVVKEFLAQQQPAVSFLFSNALVTKNKKAQHWCGQVLFEYLKKGLLPITCGDVIVDSEMGCTIWSTEKILSYIALQMKEMNIVIDKIVHVTEVPGVLDENKKTIEVITRENESSVQQKIGTTKGFDVTGGMWHKIEESLQLADEGITSLIVTGMEKDNLYKALKGTPFKGTTISPK